jgi:ParB family chromosome partitioning protein
MTNTSISKGLDALFSKMDSQAVVEPESPQDINEDLVSRIPLESIRPGKYQPRTIFDEEELNTLAASIRQNGILQPVILRNIGEEYYEIIAGERRWRASKMVGLKLIPAIIRDVSDDVAAAFSLIENIQRHNLDPIEEANALARLSSEFSLTHEEIAIRIGKPRSSVSNLLRLLNLPQEIQDHISHRNIEFGHAKLLLGLEYETQVNIAREVVQNNLSVRDLEKHIAKAKKGKAEGFPNKVSIDPEKLDELKILLSQEFGNRAKLTFNKVGKGKLSIVVGDIEEAETIISSLCSKNENE